MIDPRPMEPVQAPTEHVVSYELTTYQWNKEQKRTNRLSTVRYVEAIDALHLIVGNVRNFQGCEIKVDAKYADINDSKSAEYYGINVPHRWDIFWRITYRMEDYQAPTIEEGNDLDEMISFVYFVITSHGSFELELNYDDRY
jgi:hypothetical protein